MNENETKTLLKRLGSLSSETETLALARESAYNEAINAVRPISGDKVQTTKRNMSEELMLRYLSYSELLEKKTAELFKLKERLYSAVMLIEDPVLREIIIQKHILRRSWSRIAEYIGQSRYHVEQRLQPKALAAAEAALERIYRPAG